MWGGRCAFLFVWLHFIEQRVQPLEPTFPEFSVTLQPCGRLSHRLGFKAAGTALRVTPAGNQAGTLQHAQMLGDGRLRHFEGRSQLRHRSFPERKTRQDGATRGIRQSREGGIQPV